MAIDDVQQLIDYYIFLNNSGIITDQTLGILIADLIF